MPIPYSKNLLDLLYKDMEKTSNYLTGEEFTGANLVTIDGVLAFSILRKIHYDTQSKETTLNDIVEKALKDGKYVEVYHPDKFGLIVDEPQQLSLGKIAPNKPSPETAKKIIDSRNEILRMNGLRNRELNKWKYNQIHVRDDFLGSLKKDYPELNDDKSSLTLNDKIEIKPSLLINFAILYMAKNGTPINQIGRRHDLLKEKNEACREVINHLKENDLKWLAEVELDGTSAIAEQVGNQVARMNLKDGHDISKLHNSGMLLPLTSAINVGASYGTPYGASYELGPEYMSYFSDEQKRKRNSFHDLLYGYSGEITKALFTSEPKTTNEVHEDDLQLSPPEAENSSKETQPVTVDKKFFNGRVSPFLQQYKKELEAMQKLLRKEDPLFLSGSDQYKDMKKKCNSLMKVLKSMKDPLSEKKLQSLNEGTVELTNSVQNYLDYKQTHKKDTDLEKRRINAAKRLQEFADKLSGESTMLYWDGIIAKKTENKWKLEDQKQEQKEPIIKENIQDILEKQYGKEKVSQKIYTATGCMMNDNTNISVIDHLSANILSSGPTLEQLSLNRDYFKSPESQKELSKCILNIMTMEAIVAEREQNFKDGQLVKTGALEQAYAKDPKEVLKIIEGTFCFKEIIDTMIPEKISDFIKNDVKNPKLGSRFWHELKGMSSESMENNANNLQNNKDLENTEELQADTSKKKQTEIVLG